MFPDIEKIVIKIVKPFADAIDKLTTSLEKTNDLLEKQNRILEAIKNNTSS